MCKLSVLVLVLVQVAPDIHEHLKKTIGDWMLLHYSPP